MELKLLYDGESVREVLCSNRTFMELKLEEFMISGAAIYVLIAPLWNWNILAAPAAGNIVGSNRTFMELK